MSKRALAVLPALFVGLVLTAPYADAQHIDTLAPASASVNSSTFVLTMNGQFPLTPTPTVSWTFNGFTTQLALVDFSPSIVTATVPASLLTTPGVASVAVTYGSSPSNAVNFTVIGPTLNLTSISPNGAYAGDAGFTLTANGANFYPSTVITWNGSPVTTTFVSSSQLTTVIPASFIASPGAIPVNVSSPGQTSPSPLFFSIGAPPLTLNSISPSTAVAGSPGLSITLLGSGFTPNTVVTWNNASLSTTFNSSIKLTAAVPASLISSPGYASVTVYEMYRVSPSPFTFTITVPPITLTSISPDTVNAGSPTFTLTALGSNFTQGLRVTWNGNPLSTVYVSPTRVDATVPASLVVSPGTAAVGVSDFYFENSSSTLPFTISPALSLTSLSPATALAGGPTYALTLNGTGFSAQTVAYWADQPLATTFTGATQVIATVPASLIAQPGTFPITAQNLRSSFSQVSNAINLTVNVPLTLTSLNPGAAQVGAPAFTMQVKGGGFTPNTVVTWNGTSLATSFSDPTTLLAVVPANLLASATLAQVTVLLPGEPSPTPLPFFVGPPPSLRGITPSSTGAGGPSFTLTLDGSGFVPQTIAYWNDIQLATTYVSANQLMATVPANLIAQPSTGIFITAQTATRISNALPFTVTQSQLSLTSISPSSAIAGGPSFTVTATGSGFTGGTELTWNGTPLTTTLLSATQITGTVPAALIATTGNAAVGVIATGQTPPTALPFVITRGLTISSLSPSSIAAGGAAFSLTVNGTGFDGNTVIHWNNVGIPTTISNSNVAVTMVPANLVAQPGTAAVTAQNGTQVSNDLPFTITPSGLTLTSLSPNNAVAGGPAFTLIANGTGFNSGTFVTWNGSSLSTTFVSATQLSATVPASLILTPGTANVGVIATGQTAPPTLPFLITQPGFNLTSLSPSSVPAGSAAFSLTINGNGFTSGTTFFLNGIPVGVNFINSGQVVAAVAANLVAQTGSLSITAQNGTQPSNALTLLVTSASPLTLTSVSPMSVLAGGPSFILTATGTGFDSGAQLFWNGTPLAGSVSGSTSITATVPANLIATTGAAGVVAQNSNGQLSNPVFLSIVPPVTTPPTPTATLISVSPNTAPVGSPGLIITVTGSGFVPPSGTAITFNGTTLTTTVISTTQLTATVPAALLANLGVASVGITGQQSSPSSLPFTITSNLTLTSISPATVVAGSPAFSLTATGTGFTSGTLLVINNTALTTTLVSPTQLTATVNASLIALPGTASVTATNSNAVSNALPLKVTAPGPTITSISPNSAAAGGSGLSMSIAGTGFVSGATVSWNGINLSTGFGSATQLSAAVTATLLSLPGKAQIVVTNPDGLSSNGVTFTVTAPAPTITSISPSNVAAGGSAFTLSVAGTNFLSGATVSLGGTTLNTTFGSATSVTAAVPAALITKVGTLPVTVANPDGGSSNAVNLTVTNPVPTITSLSPSTIAAGGPAFSLTVNGTNFLSGAVVSFNGTALNTTGITATQATAQVPANLIAQAGSGQVTIANPDGGASAPATFTITGAPPTLTSIAPVSAKVGDPTFTLTLTGTGFIATSVVQWNGSPLATTFVSGTQLTAVIAASRLNLPATATVTVVNPVPNGTSQVSNALSFTITAVTPAISSLSPASAFAGDPSFTLTVNGTNFIELTAVQWNNTALTTHFVSDTQVTADVPASLLSQTGTATVTAVNPGNSVSNAVTFTINAGGPPAITSLSKTSATAGDATFTLTLTGTGFRAGSIVNFGNTQLATSSVTATQINAVVPASLLLTPATFQVSVQAGGATSNSIAFVVNLPPPPALRLAPPTVTGPAQQPIIDFGLITGYPIPLTATINLAFVSNATVPVDDPTIQFAGGGRSMTFTIPPNTTTLPAVQISTGTVAGTITISVTLTAAGVNVTPAGASASIVIARAAPVMISGKVKLIKVAGYLEVDITGFSTTRDMTQATFHLNAAPNGSFTTTDFTVPLQSLFNTWYQSAASVGFGSQFSYAQAFTVIGDTNQVQSVTVTLTNSAGASVTMTTN